MPDLDPLVDRLAALICGNAQPCYDCISGAGRALKFLANAGRLLPDGGETRTEWGVGTDADNVEVSHGPDLAAARRLAEIDGSRVFERWTGPWVEVTDA
jgi:hypothetical protein